MFGKFNESERKKNIEGMNNSVKWTLIGILCFVGVLGLAEVMLGIYKWNHFKQKTVDHHKIQGNIVERGKEKKPSLS